MRLETTIPKIGLNIEEACAASGLGRDVILGALERGELAHKRVGLGAGPGRRVVILVKSLEAWLTPTPDEATAAPSKPRAKRPEPN